jgi:hypothetical protein
MRELTSTLLAAQQQASPTPFVKVEAVNRVAGVFRYGWDRLYEGQEAGYFHALAVPGDGSLNRFRITLPSDSRKLYRQRVSAPGPESNFTQWTYTGQYNAVVVAVASLGAEISLFWINSSREVRRIKSTDYGVNWGSPELLDYSPTTYIYGISAAYKPNGDIAVFFADQSTLYVKKCVSGQWQAKSAWDRTTGDLSGVACVYGNDWDLLVTGTDIAGNYQIWSLVYGDGGDVEAGTWSALKELSSAPFDGDFRFLRPFLDRTDTYRCFFVEKFTGTEAYSRPFWSHSVVGVSYAEGLWREPVPFDLSTEYGLAMAHDNGYAWLSTPDGVWRADADALSLDLTQDVIEIRQEAGKTEGSLLVTLRNDDGQYASPGQGGLAVLDTGYGIDFSPGYVTAAGNEYSPGQSYFIESIEHRSSGGKATVILYARDGWGALAEWTARHQFRWNKAADEVSVKDMICLVLARAGLKLEVVSASSFVTGFYPDLTISSGADGRSVLHKMLEFVPDVLFIEGEMAYIVNPLSSDNPVYSYGGAHRIREGVYCRGAMGVNRVQVEGNDAGSPILADSFSWSEIGRSSDRFIHIEDRNISQVSGALQRGQACLRQAEIEAESGNILVPVNCGQQMFDVLDVTDVRAGLDCEKRRVLGTVLSYRPQRGEYSHLLRLGAV